MRVLHTADWHLGQRFHFQSRHEENRRSLEWLLEVITEERIDLLLVAGDIFDTGNPPNQARQLYYDFLGRLALSPCRHVIITGGNHDSPSMLDAPGDLLRQLHIHVIGAAPDDPRDQIFELRDSGGQLQGVVAAVPFLRDRDIRMAMPGETYAKKAETIQAGIQSHYSALADLMQPYRESGIPLLTTGHLYARGAIADESQANIYLGDRENLAAEDFPSCFHYVALGHLHRAQAVGKTRHIRYSGSMIPLSYSELDDQKSVTVIDFSETTDHPAIRLVKVPVFRRLRTIAGTLEEVSAGLADLAESHHGNMDDWVDVFLTLDHASPTIQQELHELTADMPLELLKIRLNIPALPLEESVGEHRQLDEFTPLEVFRKKCESDGHAPEAITEMERTFIELLEWMDEEEERRRLEEG